MANINIELKGSKGPHTAESLLPATSGVLRGYAVVYGSNEQQAALPGAAGANCIGIVDEDYVATTMPVRVIEFGQAVAIIGATVTYGQFLTNDAQGRLIPAGPGMPIIALALSANPNAGDFIVVQICQSGAVAVGDRVTHYTASGAIPVVTSAAGINGASALAMTLALPTAAQDGTNIFLSAETAQAHTISTPASGINGNKYRVTFSARGDYAELVALNGVWNVRGLGGSAALS